jgi:transcription antitermination protein NusB
MPARTKARKRALDVLFAAEARGVSPLVVLAERAEEPTGPDRHTWVPMGEYAESLVRGVVQNQARIDEVISEHSRDWPLQRMPAVDRAILRIATFELLAGGDAPPVVAVDEAVRAAKLLSTDDSPRFVNGVLGAIMAGVPNPRGASSA